jgi:hypothetical protein
MPTIPQTIQAGDSLTLSYSGADYPAPTWTITAYLRGPAVDDITFSPDGTNHAAAVTAATTADWPAGVYLVSLVATDGADVVTLETGQSLVLQDIAAIDATSDNRSHVKIVLDAIEAVIQGRATTDQLRVRINNREIEKTPLYELQRFWAQYKALYQDELRAAGIAQGLARANQVRVRI